MPFDIQAIVIPAFGQDFELLDVNPDDPRDDELVVDMVACGSVQNPPTVHIQPGTSRLIPR
jgi:Zn-dependent alcohol dehydrogenase